MSSRSIRHFTAWLEFAPARPGPTGQVAHFSERSRAPFPLVPAGCRTEHGATPDDSLGPLDLIERYGIIPLNLLLRGLLPPLFCGISGRYRRTVEIALR